MTTDRPVPKPYEARLIQLLEWRLKKSDFTIEDHYKVGELPLEIDVLAISPAPDWIPDFDKFPKLFDYFRRYNIMEVKTEQDRFEIEDVPKLLAYGWHYLAKKWEEIDKDGRASASDVTVTALVHHLPAATLAALPKFDFRHKSKGVYWRKSNPVARIISFTDLPDKLVPEELRVFCDPGRRRETFLSCYRDKDKEPIVEAMFDLYESEVTKTMLNITEESLKNILEGVGEERIIPLLDEKKVISTLGEDRIIALLGGTENLTKKLLARMKPEQRRQVIEENGNN